MTDTGFYAADTQLPRLAALYTPASGGTAVRLASPQPDHRGRPRGAAWFE